MCGHPQMPGGATLTSSAAVLAVLALAALVVLVVRWRQGRWCRDDMREGAIKLVCPSGKSWGWGPDGNGRCCKPGNKECSNPVPQSDNGKDYSCPSGRSWGWGSNTGKCCINNSKCVAPTLDQAIKNAQNKDESDAALAERGLVRDPVTKDVITPSELKRRTEQRAADDKKKGKTKAPKLKEGDKYAGCPPGKMWGWGSNAGKCCDQPSGTSNCQLPETVEVGKRCAGQTKPKACADGYKVLCQRTSSDQYAWRCCKKNGDKYACDDAKDSRAADAASTNNKVAVNERLSGGKCPPGTSASGSKCMMYDIREYTTWRNRWYVPRAGDGQCPAGTTSSYTYANGAKPSKSICKVTDEGRYKGWKALGSKSSLAGTYTSTGQNSVKWEGCVYGSRLQRASSERWECPGGQVDTGLNWDANGSEWGGRYQCATSKSCAQKIKDYVKANGGRLDTPAASSGGGGGGGGGGGKVVLYKNSDFGGSYREFERGEYPSLSKYDFNDAASSIKVPDGMSVTVFQNSDFGGKSVTLSAGEYKNLRGLNFSSWGNYSEGNYYPDQDTCLYSNAKCWNDSISSIKVG